MSASLVGSEMCIRDSPAPCCPPAPPGLRPVLRPAFRQMLRLVLHPGSVSYTHLTLPTICSV
eukprot:2868278-Alexandrium_andersonii.AAC.1